MKKKITRHKGGLPHLTDDDFHFGGDLPDREQTSFAELFDPTSFDREALAVMTSKRGGKPGKKFIYPSPQEYLDLHGLTAPEAERKVANFLLTARKKRLRTVAVITGKGLHSQGLPVLRDLVEGMVKAMKAGREIRNYVWENGQREKSGAIIIYL
ncbi:MAG: Smr/MutS family protein [Proteobacteria bacterium]|nr:Smr/MutS family protein [Pseudomonadota bacterium]